MGGRTTSLRRRGEYQRRVSAAGVQPSSSLSALQTLAVVALIGIVVFRLHELLAASWLIFRPALLAGGLGLIVLWVTADRTDRARILQQNLAKLIIAYMLWAAVTVPFAIWKAGALERVYGFIPLVAVVAAFALVRPTLRSFDAISTVVILCAAVLSVGALVQGKTMSGRLFATYSFDPNDLAAMMALVAPFTIMRAVRGKLLTRILCIGLLVLMMVVVAKTQSRGSAIGLAGGLFALLFAFQGRTRIFAFLGGAGLIAGLWFLSPTDFRSRMGDLTSEEGDYNTTSRSGRIQVWKRGLEYVAQNPVLGVGIGNFIAAEGEYNRENGILGKWSAPHNALVEVFAELGIPGGLLFLGIFYSALSISARSYRGPSLRSRPELLASQMGIGICGLFLGLAYFWGLFALWGFSLLLARVQSSTKGPQTVRGLVPS